MNEGPVKRTDDLIETTDCLEAIGVFRGWKNIFFAIVVICLLLTQTAFWLVDRRVVRPNEATSAAAPVPDANAIAAATDVPGQQAGTAPAGSYFPVTLLKKMDMGHLGRAIELVNGVLIVMVVLYVLAMFFCLMVSLVGRLGGIKHISRAFFLSVIVLVLVMPWQNLLGSRLPGVIYSFPELLKWLDIKDQSKLNTVLYYLRFSGYWLAFSLLLLIAQLRTTRWTKSILRRLEII
jgi:hypothetical protein